MRLSHVRRIGLAIGRVMAFTAIMSDKELSDAEYDRLMSEAEQNAGPADESTNSNPTDSDIDAIPNKANELKRTAYSELRELQRIMLHTARHDEMGTSKASAARVWRDLEILRLAKLGKPICLTTTGKPEPKQASSPMISLQPTDQSQAAA